MIALLQRVTQARVEVESRRVAEIGAGLLVLLGVEQGDSETQADRLLGGELLLVPQFTLAADTRKGRRPGFTAAAAPAEGQRMFEYFLARARERLGPVESGRFGADMQVGLVNDGPVTFWLQVSPT